MVRNEIASGLRHDLADAIPEAPKFGIGKDAGAIGFHHDTESFEGRAWSATRG